jgi:hypothetical protein
MRTRKTARTFEPLMPTLAEAKFGLVVRPREVVDALKQKGIERERPPYAVREGGSRTWFLRVPDSYRVDLIERCRSVPG